MAESSRVQIPLAAQLLNKVYEMKKLYLLLVIIISLAILSGVAFSAVWQNPELKRMVGFGCVLNWNKSFCVDNMPNFPEKIGDFSLTSYNKVNWQEECKEVGENTICTRSNNLEYYNKDSTRLIIVAPVFISRGASHFNEYESMFKGGEISSNIFELKSKTLSAYKNKMFWRAKSIDVITIGQYAYEIKPDGSPKNIQIPSEFSLLENDVSKFFIEKYPPVK